MSKKNRNPNRAGFLNTVDAIRTAENDVDKILQAARLERHESHREPLKPRHIVAIIVAICVLFMFCTILVIGFLAGNFFGGLLGAGALAICAGFGMLMASTI